MKTVVGFNKRNNKIPDTFEVGESHTERELFLVLSCLFFVRLLLSSRQLTLYLACVFELLCDCFPAKAIKCYFWGENEMEKQTKYILLEWHGKKEKKAIEKCHQKFT